MFNIFKRPASPIGTIPIQQGSFPFRGNPGHDYDTWTSPFEKATSQYTFFNAQAGNVLPSFNKFVWTPSKPEKQINFPWLTNTNSEWQAYERGHSGLSVLKMGQTQTANYQARISASWQSLYYNGGIN